MPERKRKSPIPKIPRKSPSSDKKKGPVPVKDTSKKPVTGKLSLAVVRKEVRENTGDTPGARAAFGGTAALRKAQKAGWSGKGNDRREVIYNPKRRPR